MNIIVNGKKAVLKAGSSFDYIFENRLFGGADGYSLTITFPLADCPENLEVFGQVNRMDVDVKEIVFDCELRHGAFPIKGSMTIVELSEQDVKCQFLAGKSEENFDSSLDDLYINELDLGSPFPNGSIGYNSEKEIPMEERTPLRKRSIFLSPNPDFSILRRPTPDEALSAGVDTLTCIALPWRTADDDAVRNEMVWHNGVYEWTPLTSLSLSWQPYLIFMAQNICVAAGLTYDFSAWESDERIKYLLVCHCAIFRSITDANFAVALPHWTVKEFFEKLGVFLDGDFDIDPRERKVTFIHAKTVAENTPEVEITRVVDDFTLAVSADGDDCEYLYSKPLKYDDRGDDFWKYLSCDWVFGDEGLMDRRNIYGVHPEKRYWSYLGETKEYDTLHEMLTDLRDSRIWEGRIGRSRLIQHWLYYGTSRKVSA